MASHPSEGNKLLRSTEMAMVQMFLNQECAYDCVKELGELGAVQFLDVSFVEVPRRQEYILSIKYTLNLVIFVSNHRVYSLSYKKE